jgi:hypothetical protein
MNKNSSRNNFLYLFLSFLASLMELGPVIFLLASKESILSALLVGLGYQLGNLTPSIVRLPSKSLIVMAIVGCLFSVFGEDWPFAFYVAVTLGSVALQSLRRSISSKGDLLVTTFTKRFSRIVGFAASGLFSYGIATLVLLILIFVGYITIHNMDSTRHLPAKSLVPPTTPIAVVMVIHQAHYFSYAYILPALLLLHFPIPSAFVGIYFIVGWLSYISTEKLIRSQANILVLLVGHIIVALSLSVLGYFQSSLLLVMIGWFFSGLGGGTVYCLTRLNKLLTIQAHTEMEFWEDVGHVFGVIVSIILVTYLFFNPFKVFYASAVIAVITGLGIVLSKEWIDRNSLTATSVVDNKKIFRNETYDSK